MREQPFTHKREICLSDTLTELELGTHKHGEFHSLQEGYCVVDESLTQLRRLMTDAPRSEWNVAMMRKRLVKLTAMSLKLLEFVTTVNGDVIPQRG